ncbi:MAG TPA: PBP1A family penicillin-binding protein [Candidatus Avichristensenella intestinipullorum]|uniref:Penicillin-binding protein 1A n=1 Tax=Candidatus Avichristensenella intestinipullorum TaxID=2840693 RepID=A0A9D0YZ00_9FIRM|nr:PBP1A family penicillin-binding protein [Candidatus Avichristensenella intestinipullorum]
MARKQKKKKAPFRPIPPERALVVRQAMPPAVVRREEPARPARRRRRFRVRWMLAGACAVALGLFLYEIDVVHWQKLDPVRLTRLAQTSRLYDREGSLVTVLRGPENRTVVRLSQVPQHVRDAFIAAEDLRFYSHNGFDLVRIFGSVVANLRAQSYAQGASTISQQLVKLTHLSSEKTLARKAEELYLSIQLEAMFEKDEILEMYLNTIYFGEGAYGVQAASEVYFDKDVSDLTLAEGAALAATIKAPSAYSPAADAEANRTRRGYILDTMLENGMIDAGQAEAARAEELTLSGRPQRVNAHGWFVDAALEEAEDILGVTADELLTGGYYIETTMDARLQALAESLFEDDSLFPGDAADGTAVQGALAVTDVETGGLAALIGGREYTVQRGFHRATQMRRQPGSALKPLAVYAPAIQMGYTTASILQDVRRDFGGGYNPRNAGESYHGAVTLRRALALSMNVATVQLMSEIGVSASLAFLEQAGIPLTQTDGNLSLALGSMTTGVTPAELSASYAMFGNRGVYNPPYLIERIFASDGTELYAHAASPRTVMTAQDAYLMTSLMQSVTGWGTGAKLSATGLAVAGKTGTVSLVGMSGNRDIWMAAYTSDWSLACWMGFDVTDADHRLPSRQSGGDATAALATAFFRQAYRDRERPSFSSPGGLVWLTIDTAASQASGYPMLASSATPDDYKLSEVFLESNRPWATSSLWQSPRACSYFYIDYDASGLPKLVFGATDSANYRIERARNGSTQVLTELYGEAGQTLTYVDWTASAGEWYTYTVTPVQTGAADTGVVLEGPASSQSVQARPASGLWEGMLQWLSGR